MNIGLLYDFRNPQPWRLPFPELYAALLDQAVAADHLGYDSVWISQHHFVDDGYCPAAFPVAAAIAARTRRVKIGTHVLLLPLHHPVRVAEDAAVVDVISGGRFILGVAAGYRKEEFAGFGVPRQERGSRMDEWLEIVRGCWSSDAFTYRGRHLSIENVNVQPKPIQQPYPPIWMGARGGSAIERAARLGLPLLAAGCSSCDAYLRAWGAHGRDSGEAQIGIQWPVYVAPNSEQAWNDVKEHLCYMENRYATWFAGAGDLPQDRNQSIDRSPDDLPRDAYCIGDPDWVFGRIQELRKRIPVAELIMRMQFPGLDPAKSLRSMELFARYVTPRLVAQPPTSSAGSSEQRTGENT
jgi:alkanesulfonate monooxygenase SsuD/methylene tetrahydromethanopterin reductase-like flavin-dependent oxidoreductase (luciferase family)